MFEDLIAGNAAERPASIAVRVGRESYSYADMELHIRHCAAWLGARSHPPSGRAILHLADPYAHWVLFFALEAHGVISIGEAVDQPLTQARCEALGASTVYSSLPDPGLDGVRWIRVDSSWVEAVESFPPVALPRRERAEDDPICILFSSGTTGTAKPVLLDRAMLDRRTLHAREAEFLRPGASLILTLPYKSIGGVLAALQAWLVGGTLGFRLPGTPWTETFEAADFDTLVAAPVHIQEILDELPPHTPRRDDLVVLIGGGATSKPLAAAVRERLTGSIATSYGTTESSLVTKADMSLIPDAVDTAGPILPWMDVEIVDEGGNPLPRGTSGAIRLRGTDVVSGYFRDPEDTARHFRDGWYYPGDVGRIDERGYLLVSGRIDDLMNFGGRKVVPATVEAVALGLDGVRDAAAFQAPDGDRVALWIAYCGGDIDLGFLSRALREIPHVAVVRVETIPRNQMGKIERRRLSQLVESGLLAGQGEISRLR